MSGLNLKKKWIVLFLSIFIGFCLSFSAYLLFFITPYLARRELGFALLSWVALSPAVYYILDRFLFPRVLGFTRRGRNLLLATSIFFGGFILISTNLPPFFPYHSFSIEVPPASGINAENRTISIIWITSDLGDVGFSRLQKSGDWVVSDSRLTHTGPAPASIGWAGRAGGNTLIEFEKTPYQNPLTITFDQLSTPINLVGPEGDTFTVIHTFNANHFLVPITIFVTTSFIFLLATVFLLSVKIKTRSTINEKRFAWLLYALPMVFIWVVFLLTFFPGMMSGDSNVQWGQILTGQFNDTHPVFHTLSMWLVTRIWLSPAAVVLSQILFLSLTVAWGIRLLEEHGLPPWGSWLLAVIFAIAPLNGNMVVVVWKDIPYSTSLFLFSLMVLKIVLTNGAWLAKRLTWLWIGLVSLCVTSFRHNGLPIPFATILVMMIFYRKWWKPLLQALALTTILYGFIHGPIYNALKIGHRPLGFVQEVMLHHISAHINTGKPLTPSEQELADFILPRDQWGYDCCTALPIMRSPSYPGLETEVHGPAIRELFIDLAVKEPLVELNHLKCVSSIVWRSPGFCGANTLVPHNANSWIGWYVENYNTENSLIPLFQKPLAEFLIKLRTDPSLTILISPGVYLWFSIYTIGIFAIRFRNWRALFFSLPILIQAATYLLINISDNFRYHYGAYLMGLFGVGLLLLALCHGERGNSTDIK